MQSNQNQFSIKPKLHIQLIGLKQKVHLILLKTKMQKTRGLGTLQAPTSSWRPLFKNSRTLDIRDDLPKKRMFTFGHCPNQGGGKPLPESFGSFFTKYLSLTRSLGALRAPTSSWGPFGPGLRPSRPSGAQAARPTQVTVDSVLAVG